MDRIFLCIGAGPGIGLATSIRFAKEGLRPVLAARNAERLAALAEEVERATGQKAECVTLDAGDAAQVAALGERYAGELEVLHYNAAVVHAQPLAEATCASLDEDIRVGVIGALAAIKTFAPSLCERGRGSILLTGGMLAHHPHPDYLALGVAKAGIRSMAHALFDELAGRGVHIACANVSRAIAPRSPEAAEVAELFWRLHSQPKSAWTCEESDV